MGVNRILESTIAGKIFGERKARKEAQTQRAQALEAAAAAAAAAEEKRKQAEQSVMLQKEKARKRTLFAGDPEQEQENDLFKRSAFGNKLGS